jgi:KinB signaling pathway activation protein
MREPLGGTLSHRQGLVIPMSKLLRLYLIIAAVAFFAAFAIQAFVPQIGGSGTIWGLAPGWQREIAFWNIAMLVVVVGILRAEDGIGGRALVGGLVTLGLLLGTNHLVAIISDPYAWAHYLPMIANYLGTVVGAVVLLRERRA